MGDVGSLFIGFVCGVMALGTQKPWTITTYFLGCHWVHFFYVDTTSTLIQRMFNKKPPMDGSSRTRISTTRPIWP